MKRKILFAAIAIVIIAAAVVWIFTSAPRGPGLANTSKGEARLYAQAMRLQASATPDLPGALQLYQKITARGGGLSNEARIAAAGIVGFLGNVGDSFTTLESVLRDPEAIASYRGAVVILSGNALRYGSEQIDALRQSFADAAAQAASPDEKARLLYIEGVFLRQYQAAQEADPRSSQTRQDGIDLFRRIVKEYPASKVAPFARLRLALAGADELSRYTELKLIHEVYRDWPECDARLAAMDAMIDHLLKAPETLGVEPIAALERSRELAEEIIELAPYSGTAGVAHLALASYYSITGDTARARRHLRTIPRDTPQSSIVEQARRELEALDASGR